MALEVVAQVRSFGFGGHEGRWKGYRNKRLHVEVVVVDLDGSGAGAVAA